MWSDLAIKKEIDTMRNGKGRFIHGHPPIASRDSKTGRFIKKTMGKTVEEEVDDFLFHRVVNECLTGDTKNKEVFVE